MGLIKETKKISQEVITKANCDKCNCEINFLTFLNDTIQTKSETVRTTSKDYINGVNIKYTFGYGTEFDSSKAEITLCEYCIADLIIKFGGIIKE